ncbi:APC family permease [Allokutzneria sp. A3M-2-11 16]|uniref:APC family permease n=1 Tax=Allokutzneria sp. A3M-2-11 16 TaxID=2962043 RepID=UPI0020B6D035|nr:APC family permease [Allokutzneria sp. A3M-2-11 16]MCP3802778.1 APC family permease [Allokutzneria sp. A3M-2-11 16]
MHTTPKPSKTGKVTSVLAKDRLGVPAVTYFAISMGSPFLATAGVITSGYAITGQVGIPVGIVVMGAVLALFAVGFVTMAPYVPNAGAFNAYISKGIGRPAGVAAGWMALLSYNAMQVGLYGALGDAAKPLLRAWFGIDVAWWVIALVGWAIVAFLGMQHIDLNGKVLAVLLAAEVLVVLVYAVSSLFHPADGSVSLVALEPSHLFEPGVGALLALALLAFIGFETAVVFSEEARSPGRTVPVATFSALAVMAVLYLLASLAMSVAAGPAHIGDMAHQYGSGLVFHLAGEQLGPAMVGIGRFLYFTSVLACMIAVHNTAARYAFAMGRERVLPAVFGQTSHRNSSPKVGSLSQSALGLVVILVYAVIGGDPLRDLFYLWNSAGALGILILLALTSITVLVYFARNPSGEPVFRRVVAPAISSVCTVIALVLVLVNLDKVFDLPSSSPVLLAIPGAYVLIGVFGVLWGLHLRANRPEIYANIGRGAKSAARTGLGLGLGAPDEQ